MEIEKARREVRKLTLRFIEADKQEARTIKRTLSGNAGMAKRYGNDEIYRIYSRAARRLKTPKR